jgi:hypothetical protein
VLRVNYALFSVCITAYVVSLLSLAGLPGRLVAEHRVLNTLLGGSIALSAYAGAAVSRLLSGGRHRAGQRGDLASPNGADEVPQQVGR